mmetsp:Transcript_135395/g.306345  ORF Transcript_135395/g.306345 Transcript_135395/m.306345 type:complete len:209 (-) Transcript_135395:1135-1761(-)
MWELGGGGLPCPRWLATWLGQGASCGMRCFYRRLMMRLFCLEPSEWAAALWRASPAARRPPTGLSPPPGGPRCQQWCGPSPPTRGAIPRAAPPTMLGQSCADPVGRRRLRPQALSAVALPQSPRRAVSGRRLRPRVLSGVTPPHPPCRAVRILEHRVHRTVRAPERRIEVASRREDQGARTRRPWSWCPSRPVFLFISSGPLLRARLT